MYYGLVFLSVCLSVCIIQIECQWLDLDDWYGLSVIGDYSKIVLFNYQYLLSVTLTWQRNDLVKWDQYQPVVPLLENSGI
jgi:hypothetical protein